MAETRDSFVHEQHYSVYDTEPVDRGPHSLSSSRGTDILVLIQGQALKCSQYQSETFPCKATWSLHHIMFCIVGSWTWFSLLEMFHLSSKRLLEFLLTLRTFFENSVWECPYRVVKDTCWLWVSESLEPLVGRPVFIGEVSPRVNGWWPADSVRTLPHII